ncbi:alpha/beta fold hydrolase [Picosynechococcus sp. NKBG15041c]|uniref:alpha/beta fold hydrolase n=1 Tax=Picosynechococcus sp. NKBG15041c TaxID=1407650 RepID=UPI001F269934|nr:alpha/beta fold hydrolase [Picosynechococcus sp. NKBG15041c]
MMIMMAIAQDRKEKNSPTELKSWPQRIGVQRSWLWRGWQIRYSFWRSSDRRGRSPILLLHGFGAALEHWRGLIPQLAQDRDVYAVDLLGFGGSRKGEANFGVPLWTEQLEDFLRLVVRRPVILLGNSLGSLVCATLGQNPKNQVQAIALLSVPDVAQRQAMLPKPLRPIVNGLERSAMQPWLLKLIFRLARQPLVLKNWLKLAYPSWPEIDAELLAIVQAPTCDQDADTAFVALSRRVGQPGFAPPMAEVLAQVQCPIFILWGEQDRFVPVAIAPKLAATNPQINLTVLPGLGHCPQDEAPAQIYELFSQWLEATNGL